MQMKIRVFKYEKCMAYESTVLSAILVCVSQVALKFSFPLLVNPAKLKPHT